MEEEKKVEYVKDAELNLLKIESEGYEGSENKPQRINRIRFYVMGKTKFEITWKPKVEKKTIVNKLPITTKIPMDITNMPEALTNLLELVNQNIVKIKACYSVMKTTDPEGNPKIYRFITSLKTLEKWEILGEKVEVEQIME